MLKKILKSAEIYAKHKEYLNTLQQQRAMQQDQNIAPFDLSASVEQEILAQKEAKCKARNKRKANKK